MKTEKIYQPLSGYLALILIVAMIGLAIFLGIEELILPTILLAVLSVLFSIGLVTVQPNKSCVLVLFGAYKGTIKDNGFFWVNPFFAKTMMSLRAQNFNSEPIKVNDKVGNPIMIGVVLVWKVEDTFKAAFEVDKYEHFVVVQSEAALRKLAGIYPYDNFEEARRIAEWKRSSGALLAFIADDIISRLSDIAPELGNKLWSALKTFETAETNEQYAQVTASCRRIFEYVTDCIFPPTDEKIDGHSLKAPQYKNRLFAYADNSRKSDTNIDLIVASTVTLVEQWGKINELSNKGVHSEVYRSETRRCLLRTIMLLDDIVSLKVAAFEIKPKINFDDIFKDI